MGTRIRRLLTLTASLGAGLLLALPASAQGDLQSGGEPTAEGPATEELPAEELPAEELAAEELAADLAEVLDQPAIGPAEAAPVPLAPSAPVDEVLGETLDQALDTVEDVPAPSPVQELVTDVTGEVRTVTGSDDPEGSPSPGRPGRDPVSGAGPAPVRPAGGTTTPAQPAGPRVSSLALHGLRAPVGATSLRGFRTDARRAVVATVNADDALLPIAATAPPTARSTIEPAGAHVPQLPGRIGVQALVAAALLVLATAGLLAELGPRRSA
ncbi:MAG TPA: hypothetical protein VHF25_04540 [Nitriliruptorales bacterium]|nr:hypothetical protein [Nitriliruptorales bacterium]